MGDINHQSRLLLEETMLAAGETVGLVAERLVHGDEFFGWQHGGKVVSFGWVTFSDRTLGLSRLAERPGGAFLYNFYTLRHYRGQGLYSALLFAIRIILSKQKINEFIIDANMKNKASVKGIEKAGFHPVARISYFSMVNRWSFFQVQKMLGAIDYHIFAS